MFTHVNLDINKNKKKEKLFIQGRSNILKRVD